MFTLNQTLPISRIPSSPKLARPPLPPINSLSPSPSSVNTPSTSLSLSNAAPLSLGPEAEAPRPKTDRPPNSCPLTPLDFLERAAVAYRGCPSIVYNGAVRTWDETRARCLRLASSIAALGIKRGEVVSVLAPNVPAMCELHFAVPMAGAVLNTLNLRLDFRAVANLLLHAESRLVFVDSQSASVASEAISSFPPGSARPVLVLIRDEHYESALVVSKDYDRDAFHDLEYEDMVKRGDPGFEWVRPESEWDPISLNYTSGTTSSPKGVVNSHRGAFLISLGSLLDWSVPRRPVYLWTLPMFHANGWNYAWALAAVGGTSVCLRCVDAPSIYKAIERHGVTHMCGAPIVLNMLANHSPTIPRRGPPEGPIIHVMTAGAPPAAAVIARIESLGFSVSHGYGLTETGGPVVTCAWKPEWDRLQGPDRARMKSRQGIPTVTFSGCDVVEVETGRGVPRDGTTVGEIVLRGGSLMLGYLKDEEGTKGCMRDGWFYTGDVGVIHPDGYLEVKDRSKDVIICGGENLSSVEIEAVLYTHPAVNEAAVVARPSTFWGETPCAFVSLKGEGERPSEKDIREHCKERLPLYMVPRKVVFRDELPKTSTGKMQKFLLREMAKELED